jgi:hypothetical protein
VARDLGRQGRVVEVEGVGLEHTVQTHVHRLPTVIYRHRECKINEVIQMNG